MFVENAMTKDPFTIDPEAPLGTAIDVMRTKNIRHLPVVDEAGQLVGIITDRDLRQAAFAPAIEEYLSASARQRLRQLGDTLDNLRVRDAMTWGVVTTQPDALLGHAALLMSERRIGSLPVVDNGRDPRRPHRARRVAGRGARRQRAQVRSRGLSLVGPDHCRPIPPIARAGADLARAAFRFPPAHAGASADRPDLGHRHLGARELAHRICSRHVVPGRRVLPDRIPGLGSRHLLADGCAHRPRVLPVDPHPRARPFVGRAAPWDPHPRHHAVRVWRRGANRPRACVAGRGVQDRVRGAADQPRPCRSVRRGRVPRA